MHDRDASVESAALESTSPPVHDADFATAASLGGALALVAGDVRRAMSFGAPAQPGAHRGGADETA